MSVSRHLQIDLDEYDARIRTFVPEYEVLLDAAAAALDALTARRPHVVELGIGSGALAARCLARRPGARLTGIDSDAGILEQAARRLRPYGGRVTLLSGDFSTMPLPPCDAMVASLSLHHLHTRAAKTRVYRRAVAALRTGGLLVNADAALADDPRLRRRLQDAWRAHLRQHYSAGETAAYFRAWSREDVYFTLNEELAMMRAVGATAEVIWRVGGFAVLAARTNARARTPL
jgi:trans-aconitate methyltransferase